MIVRFKSSQVAVLSQCAQEFVEYLSWPDSIQIATNSVEQMACVTVNDNKTYSL